MTNWLLALRLAPNLEAAARSIQDRLFADLCLPTARLLPPLMPLGWTDSEIPDPALDEIRKRAPLTAVIPVRSGIAGAAGQLVPFGDRYRGVGLPCSTESRQWGRLCERVARAAPTLRDAPGMPVLALAWQRAAVGGVTPLFEALRADSAAEPRATKTAALWLCRVEVEAADEDPWWNGARWWLTYSRRLTTKDGPPGTDRVPR